MKLDLGIVSFELSDDIPAIPALFSMVGVQDKKEALAAGPTMSKSEPLRYRRTFSVAVSAPQGEEAPQETLARTQGEVLKRSIQSKVRKTEDRAVAGQPALVTVFSHKHGQTPLRSFVLISLVGPWVVTALHTGLDVPENEAEMVKQFETFAGSVSAG